MPHLNLEKITRFFHEDLDSDLELLKSLVEILSQQFTEFIDYQFTAEDLNSLERISHKLKSSARSFGLDSIYENMSQLEEQSREEKSDLAEVSLAKLQASMPSALKEVYDFLQQVSQKVKHG